MPRRDSTVTSNAQNPQSDYRAWIEAIFAALCNALGGDHDQAGSSRRYGSGIFGYGMNYKPGGEMGEVLFQVSRTDDPLRRMVSVGPFEWYAHVDTVLVANKLLDAFEHLAPSAA